MREYALCVDLGKRRDFTAFMVLQDNPQILPGARLLNAPDRVLHIYDVTFIDQMQHRSYPYVVSAVAEIMGSRQMKHNAELIVGATGVGEPVIDMMREKHLMPVPIIETGGEQVHEVYAQIGEVFSHVPGKLSGSRMLKEIHVPRDDLVAAGNLILQQARVRVARGLRWGPALMEQLNAFKDRRKRKAEEPEDESVHDDLVTCFLLGAWWFTRSRRDGVPQERIVQPAEKPGDWSPYDFW